MQRGEGCVDNVERGGHDVGNGLDRGRVGVVDDKMPARVGRRRQYNK